MRPSRQSEDQPIEAGLCLKRAPEGLYRGGVVTISRPAHALLDAGLVRGPDVILVDVLTAAI
jgi:hypothetical protein